jgi:predicted dehydrogenase
MLKGGLIGTGKIALTGHMPAYEKLKEKLRITAACDVLPESREMFSKQFPGIPVYNTAEELLESEELDFIDICTPPALRKEQISLGVKNGLAILCEKPFSISEEDALEQKLMLEKHDRVFMSCHQYRYSPIWKHFERIAGASRDSSKKMLQFNVYRTEADTSFSLNPLWRIEPKISGGGIIADTGVHYLNLSLWMMGKPVKLFANISNLKHKEYNVEDTAVIVIESERGITGINLTWAADRRDNSAKIISGNESLFYNGTELIKYEDGKKKIMQVPDASDKSTYVSLYISLLKEFVKRINDNTNCRDLIDEAYNSILLLMSCYKSAGLGKTVNFTLED